MLSSNMSSVPATSVALRHSLNSSTHLLRSSGSLLRRLRSNQHVRNFRLDMWSSYLDPTFQKEFHRRFGWVSRQKHVVALNRKLSWDRHPPPNVENGSKGFMCSAWRGEDSRGAGRWIKVDGWNAMDEFVQQSKDDMAKGAKIMNHGAIYEIIRAKRRFFGNGWVSINTAPNDPLTESAIRNDPWPQDFLETTTYGQEGFRRRFHQQKAMESEDEIDPITNRRIPKISDVIKEKELVGGIPSKSFQAHHSQPQDFEPPASTTNSASSDPSIEFYSLRDRLRNFLNFEEPSENRASVQDGLTCYDEKVDYKSGRFYDCAGVAIDHSDHAQLGLRDYDNKISYGKAYSRPDFNIAKNTHRDKAPGYDAENSSGGFDEKSKIKTQTDSVVQAIEDYESRPAGQPPHVETSDKACESLDPVQKAIREYEKTEQFKQSQKEKKEGDLIRAIQNYEKNFRSSTTNSTSGNPDIEKLNPVLRAMEEYEAVSEETNTTHDGSGGPLDPVLKAIREYRNTIRQEPAENGEPVKVQGEQHSVDKLLQAFESSGVYAGRSVDALSSQQQDKCPVQDGLQAYDEKVNNYRTPFHGQKPIHILTFPSKSPSDKRFKSIADDTTEDLDLLRASDVRAGSGIIKGSAKGTEAQKAAKRKELQHDFDTFYKATESPPKKKPGLEDSRKPVDDLRTEHSELLNHAAHARGRINAKLAEVEAGWPEKSTKHRAKMTGNFVRDFPEEFEGSWTTSPDSESLVSNSKVGQEGNTNQTIIATAPKEPLSRHPRTPRLETSLNRTKSRTAEKKVDDVLQAEGDISPMIQFSVFPESKQGLDKLESLSKGISEEDIKARAVNALEANQVQDIGSTLKSDEDTNLVREVQSKYEDRYDAIDIAPCQAPVSQPKRWSEITASSTEKLEETPEPTLYKILAYDPTMQSVSTASTTSMVSDTTDPLSPADALLRLSNPSKFFPHFAGLQAQGYEIVAGSGDVLVFRKVRAGSAIPSLEEKTLSESMTAAEAAAEERKRLTNPIDGTQASPVAATTGDFASPTGFVNHDLPRGSETPFESGINVRREEPVFSGRRNWEDSDAAGRRGKKKGRKGTGRGRKVLVGAVGVAGVSYAVGVISEFFRMGGMDGKGPQGF